MGIHYKYKYLFVHRGILVILSENSEVVRARGKVTEVIPVRDIVEQGCSAAKLAMCASGTVTMCVFGVVTVCGNCVWFWYDNMAIIQSSQRPGLTRW